MEIIVLVIFVIAIVLCIVSGVRAFISMGCSLIYILGDPVVCTGMLNQVRLFLLSFLFCGCLSTLRLFWLRKGYRLLRGVLLRWGF